MSIEGINVFTGEPTRVEIEGSKISAVRTGQAGGRLPYLAPGFIDMQVNGYRGLDYTAPDFERGNVGELVRLLAASGTTKHVPTIVTSSRERILRNLAVLADARRTSEEIAAAIPGYHVEGPFISPENGPRGAHSPNHVRLPDLEEFLAWQEAAEGLIKIVTLAPELPGALPFIEEVSARGVLVAIGHSGASPETVRAAVGAGALLSTHLGNGSHALIPRLANYIWEQLAADELTAGIIADGFHLPASVVKTFTRAKGLDRLFLVSDVALLGGEKPGIYPWGDITCEVFDDGHIGLHGSPGLLAGAGHLLDWDVAHFVRAAGVRIDDAVRLCTTTPRRLLGLEPIEFPRVGQEADLVLFDFREGEPRLGIRRTLQAGRTLFEQR